MNSVYEISLYKSFTATECVEYRGQWCDECGEDNGGCLFCYNCGVRKEIIKCSDCSTIQNYDWVRWNECECEKSNHCPSCFDLGVSKRCVRRDCLCHCMFCLGWRDDESDDDESDDDESDDDDDE